MQPDIIILTFVALGMLAFIGMGLWTLNKTLQHGINEMLTGMEEIVRALRQNDRP